MLNNFLFKKLEEFLYRRKFIKFNKKIFKDNKKENNGIFLIEFNAFHDSHVMYSIFSNYIKKKFNFKIEAFFNYCLTSAPLYFNTFNRIKWFIGNKINLNTFGVYRSFNVENIFRPIIGAEINRRANIFFKKNFKKIKKKEDVLNIKINNILIGELLYDSYIRLKRKPTLDVYSEDFKNYYLNFIELTFFWIDCFEKKKIKGLVTSHSVYSYGLPTRIAISKGIPCYILSVYGIVKINKNTLYGGVFGNVQNYKKDFKRLDSSLKSKGLAKAKKILDQRLKHGSIINHEFENRSSFGPITKKRYIKNKNNFNVLICTHDFFDAVHYHGKSIFPDFYEWLLFLGEFSKSTNFDWYIKNHPKYSGKFKLYQPKSDNIVKKFLKENKHIKLLPNNLSNKQIIKEGLNIVLTVYGSVASEFPYYSIPVINASYNPHVAYKFSETPRTLKEYKEIIKNLKKIKINKNNIKELYEFYFMKNLLSDNNWLTGDYSKMIKKIGGYQNLQSYIFYKFWIKYFDNEKLVNLSKRFDIYLNSKDSRLQVNH